jgi:hypothetical protein
MAKFQNISSGLGSVGAGVNATLFPTVFGSVNILSGFLVQFYTAGPTAYNGVYTGPNDLTGSYIVVEINSAGNQALVSWETFPLEINLDNDNIIYFVIAGNTVLCRKKVATVITTLTTFAYVAATHKFLRLREENGVVYWDTSPDGIAWTNHTSELTANLFDLTAVSLGIGCGCYDTEASDTDMSINSINGTKKVVDRRFFKPTRPAIFTPGRAR